MRKEFDEAEIHRLDLSELCLEIISQGYELEKLDWFEAPSLESWQKARNQLKGMGLLNENGSINSDGKLISKKFLYPRNLDWRCCTRIRRIAFQKWHSFFQWSMGRIQ